jgi:transposase
MRIGEAEAEAKWFGLIKEQEQSGQSVAGFCRERGVRASQLYGWKKRIRERPDQALWKSGAAPNQQALVGAETERLKFAFMEAADFWLSLDLIPIICRRC